MSDLEPPPDDAWVRRLARRPDQSERDAGPCLSDEGVAARIERRRRPDDDVDAHLAKCPACRSVVRELILDGAGDHPPVLQPVASPPAGWRTLLGPWVPRRLAASGGGLGVALLAVTAMAAIALPLASRMLDRAAEPPRVVPTIWRVSSTPEPPPEPPPESPPSAAETPPAEAMDAPGPAPGSRRVVSTRRRRPRAPSTGGGPTAVRRRPPDPAGPAAIVLPKLPTTKVVRPPAPPPPAPAPRSPEPEAYTAADEVFFDEVQAIGILSYERKFEEALERVARLRPVASHSVTYTGVLNKLRNEAQRGLDKARGPCDAGYLWQRYEKRGATEKWRCVLPEEAEKILDR